MKDPNVQVNILGHRLGYKMNRISFLENMLFILMTGEHTIPENLRMQVQTQKKAWTLELQALQSEVQQIEETLEILTKDNC